MRKAVVVSYRNVNGVRLIGLEILVGWKNFTIIRLEMNTVEQNS